MRLVILLSMAVLTSSASLNDDLCVKGESFWCESLTVAEACGAVDHCKETIWKTTNLEEDESDVCRFCQAVISDAREMFAAGKSENEVITFLSSAIDLLPDATKASESKETLKRRSLQNILNSEIAPQTVCSLLDVCKGLPLEEDLHKEESSSEEETPEQPREADDPLLPSSCADCTKFFTSLKNFITVPTSAFLTDIFLDEVCPHTGRVRKQCEQLATFYLPMAINITAGFLDPVMVCQSIKMCKNSQIKNHEEPFQIDLSSIDWEGLTSLLNANMVLEQARQTNELRQPSSCNDCLKFFTSLRDLLKNDLPAFVTDIIFDQVCSRLGKHRKQCEDTVKLYLPSAIEFAANFLDPKQVCQLTRMCKKSLSQNELNSISWTKIIIPNKTKGDTKTCEACKNGMKFVQTFLKSEAVKSSIEMIIGNLVCVRLGPLHAVCEKLVKTELRMVMDLMARLMDPVKVCRAIRLCQNSDLVLEEDSLPVLEDSEPLGTGECLVCETIIRVLSAAIDNKTEEEILKAMHGLCSHLPSEHMTAVCNMFVNNYGKKVMDAIRQQMQPHDICAKFGLCVALNFDILDVAAVVGSEPCIICRSVVQYVEAYIDQDDTVSTIQATLKVLCHSLSPAVEQQVCLPFVEKYTAWLVHELSVSMPPKFFCTVIRICTN